MNIVIFFMPTRDQPADVHGAERDGVNQDDISSIYYFLWNNKIVTDSV